MYKYAAKVGILFQLCKHLAKKLLFFAFFILYTAI